MTLRRKFSRAASATVCSITSAWFDGDGRAVSRMRPALGQPTSPMTISLSGIAAATTFADGIDMGGGQRSRQRKVLPVWQNMNGDEIDRVLQVGIAQPIFPDIGIGDRHRHLRFDFADQRRKVGDRQIAAQQHFVADDDRGDDIGKSFGERDGGGDLLLVFVRLVGQPNALHHFHARGAARCRRSDRGRCRPNRCGRSPV